jgi:hypothetical protein
MTRTPPEELHESEEELRFFSEPPAYEKELASSSEMSSLSPTTRGIDDGEETATLSDEERAEALRFEAWRATLRRRVAATLCVATALLFLAGVARLRAEDERRSLDAAVASLPASPAADDVAPTDLAVPSTASPETASASSSAAPSAPGSASPAAVPAASNQRADSAALIR